MKHIFGMIAVGALLMSCSAGRVQTTYPDRNYRAQQSFYYYPAANVYYDGSCNNYIYHNGRSWVRAPYLPPGIYMGNDRVQVYFNGPDVWRNNPQHRNLYYKQPPVVYEKRYDDRRYRHRERRNDNRSRGRNNKRDED